MTSNAEEQVQVLEAGTDRVLAGDTLAEAGRKVLLAKFATILEYEIGNEAEDNKAAVQNMLSAIHQMQAALKLLKPDYKPKTLRLCKRSLTHLSNLLSKMQNLDSLAEDLHTFGASLEAEQRVTMDYIVDKLIQQHTIAHEELIMVLGSKEQRRFLKSLKAHSSKIEVSAERSDKVEPSQVRYLLPRMIYDRLAVIRAYDEALNEAGIPLLEALRVEFRRLLYTVSLFEDVLGKQITSFVEELQALQSTLDQIHDTAMTQRRLDRLMNTGKKRYAGVLETYTTYRNDKTQALVAEFKEQWAKFNSRKVQQKLSTALLVLYEN